MERAKPDRLIINSPYAEPSRYWKYNPATGLFRLEDGRRPAGYLIASDRSQKADDPGVFVEIPLVNEIRPRVKAWRAAGYPGATGITRRLLAHWHDPEQRQLRLFFCQLEAIETLIWLAEAPAADRTGVTVPGDGGPFRRLCSKMATGSGKTIVMAMLIAWQVLNKVAYPQDRRYSKNVLVVAPGLTVRSRLEVLHLAGPGNYYEQFRVVPDGLWDRLRQGKVLVQHRHNLEWETDKEMARKRSVDKRGPKSDEAYARAVLGDMARAANLLVINDEAHHAWRVPAEGGLAGVAKAEIEEATKWVGGLDRLHRARGILTAYDFSATPFAPSGKKSTQEALFGWIVSDFGLTDAIESGLVKTPRVVIRDDALPDARTYRSRLYHLYRDPEVTDDLNRKAAPEEPLPDLVRNAYNLLGYDWKEKRDEWAAAGLPTPPVMITVCNRTETAARVKFMFDRRRTMIDALSDPARTLHIDSRVLAEAEEQSDAAPIVAVATEEDDDTESGAAEAPRTKQQQAEYLRRQVDTVGKPGQPGAMIQNVISVAMLSEGWDARTVTHIMGLRAFSSQLLCEQVVGRGLRRTVYEVEQEGPDAGLFAPEYVNIFGVPFAFLPHEETDGGVPRAGRDVGLEIRPDPDKAQFEIGWPNVLRVQPSYRPVLSIDWSQVERLELNAANSPQLAEVAPVLEGKPDVTRIAEINLERMTTKYRYQRIIFEAAADVYERLRADWKGSREVLLGQIVRLTEQFVHSDRIHITPELFNSDQKRRRLLLALNMSRVTRHLERAIRFENADEFALVLDEEQPVKRTGDMLPWNTTRHTEVTERSHINRVVFDSTWESTDEFQIDRHPAVAAWVKNDHLGFHILYIWNGTPRKYRPDFLIRLANGEHLIVETKGEYDESARAKRQALDEWITAVNTDGRFGRWHAAITLQPGEIVDVLAQV